MAEYQYAARSNYFKVRDLGAFQAWARSRHIDVWDSGQHPGKHAIAPACEHHSDGWQFLDDDNEIDIFAEIDILAELAPHLADGEVAVLMEAGFTRQAVNGWAGAVFHDGRTVMMHVDDIYAKAAEAFGVDVKAIAEASY